MKKFLAAALTIAILTTPTIAMAQPGNTGGPQMEMSKPGSDRQERRQSASDRPSGSDRQERQSASDWPSGSDRQERQSASDRPSGSDRQERQSASDQLSDGNSQPSSEDTEQRQASENDNQRQIPAERTHSRDSEAPIIWGDPQDVTDRQQAKAEKNQRNRQASTADEQQDREIPADGSQQERQDQGSTRQMDARNDRQMPMNGRADRSGTMDAQKKIDFDALVTDGVISRETRDNISDYMEENKPAGEKLPEQLNNGKKPSLLDELLYMEIITAGEYEAIDATRRPATDVASDTKTDNTVPACETSAEGNADMPDTNDNIPKNGQNAQMPGTDQQNDRIPQMPGNNRQNGMMPGNDQQSAQMPQMPGNDQQRAQPPQMPGNDQQSAQMPQMPGNDQQSGQMPGNDQQSGQMPQVPGNDQQSAQPPQMPGNDQQSAQPPQMPGTDQQSAQMPGNNQQNAQMPQMSGNDQQSSQMPRMPGNDQQSGQMSRMPGNGPMNGQMGGVPGEMPGEGGNVSYSAAATLTDSSDGTDYTSSADNENAVLVKGSDISLTHTTVTKTGSSSGESADFNGTNAAVLAADGATLTISDTSVSTDGGHANGVFSYGSGTTVNVSNTTITTTGNNSGGLMTTGGATTNASDVTVSTSGNSSAAIRSDRGGGTVNVTRGTYDTAGVGSPAIYSTADITVSDATLSATRSEAVVIEGGNSVTLDNVNITGANTTLNGQSTRKTNVLIYQSMSGDASGGSSSFTMTGGAMTAETGSMFHVTNVTTTINLENVDFTYATDSDVFLDASADAWGSTGKNGGNVTLNLVNQDITGAILSDAASSVALVMDDDSTWTLTGDSYVSSFEGDLSRINTNGYTLYVNGAAVN